MKSGTHRPRSVLLVAHTGRPDIVATATKVASTLSEHGIRAVGLFRESRELELEPLVDTELQSDGDSGPVEMVLAIGGDGTLLRAAEAARPLQAPVLGINLGRVGFLAEADIDNLDDALRAIVHRDYLRAGGVTVRMTVDVTIERDGEILDQCWALNEVSVEKATRERILDVVVEVDGRGVSAFGCDGVLCATPTGSTAYAFSAGGPIVWPDVEALLVAPSNAHALFARPLVVSPNSTVTVHIDPAGHNAVLACDGRRIHEVPSGSRVQVRRGITPVAMVRLSDQPFTDRLVRKFALPVHGWRDQRY